ncbi:MAG: hypothetical protein ABSA03_17620 [Streptosporangiaceae bacterium]
MTGFPGSNGAGKSTTMRVIIGLDAPSSGISPSADGITATTRHHCKRGGAVGGPVTAPGPVGVHAPAGARADRRDRAPPGG